MISLFDCESDGIPSLDSSSAPFFDAFDDFSRLSRESLLSLGVGNGGTGGSGLGCFRTSVAGVFGRFLLQSGLGATGAVG